MNNQTRAQIECSQKTVDELCQQARQILKRTKELMKREDLTPDDREQLIKQDFKDFCVEFPSVFSSITRLCVFHTEPFKKYLVFRSKQKPVYTQEEDSIKDLMKYPLLLWKFQNPHYDQSQYNAFKRHLEKEITDGYRQTKKEFKETYEKFVSIKQKREEERHRNLVLDILRKCSSTATIA